MTLAHSSASVGKSRVSCSKFPTYIYYNAHEIPIAAQSHQGNASSFIKHSYTWYSYSDPQLTDPQCPHSPHRRRHSPHSPSPLSPRSRSPLSPRRSPALLQSHGSLRDDCDEDMVTGVWTSSRPTQRRLMRIRRRRPQPRRRAGRLRPRADVDSAPSTITRTTSFATEVSPA
jgi:hypothetical protein